MNPHQLFQHLKRGMCQGVYRILSLVGHKTYGGAVWGVCLKTAHWLPRLEKLVGSQDPLIILTLLQGQGMEGSLKTAYQLPDSHIFLTLCQGGKWQGREEERGFTR